MNDRVVEGGVSGMAVYFPVSIREVELDRTADWLAPVDANGGIGEIGTRFAVPGAELNDLDPVAGNGNEVAIDLFWRGR